MPVHHGDHVIRGMASTLHGCTSAPLTRREGDPLALSPIHQLAVISLISQS
jgi:hypothetical protein